MKIEVSGVLRPMEDERAIDLAVRNQPFRDGCERLAAHLQHEHPDVPAESFQVVRVIRGYYDRVRRPEEA